MSSLIPALVCLLWFSFRLGAEVSDTIWAGDLPISNLSFQQIHEGVLRYPTLSGGKLSVPVEIWFWNSGEAWLMFDNARWGHTDRERTQIWVPQNPNSARWEYISPYSYNAQRRAGTLQGRSTRLINSSYYYSGYFIAWSASFKVSGNKLKLSKVVFSSDTLVKVLSSSADPRNLPKGIRFSRYPTFGPVAVLTKSGGKPSLATRGVDY